jgi:hypothetical protein
MKSDLMPGLRHVETLRVDSIADRSFGPPTFAGFADMPPVLATALMVGFIEWTCIEALKPYLDEGERNGRHPCRRQPCRRDADPRRRRSNSSPPPEPAARVRV